MQHWRRWAGQTVVCLASGPSMCAEDADYVRGRARAITVNSTWQLAPWADAHYSSDVPWWDANLARMRDECSGEFWTGDPEYRPEGMHGVRYDRAMRGVSSIPGVIAWGGNSGYCAIGLAYQFGASRIVLLGFDQQGEHWHSDHPDGVKRPANFPMWRERFKEMARDFRRLGVDVVNCSRETTLRCFRREELRETLC